MIDTISSHIPLKHSRNLHGTTTEGGKTVYTTGNDGVLVQQLFQASEPNPHTKPSLVDTVTQSQVRSNLIAPTDKKRIPCISGSDMHGVPSSESAVPPTVQMSTSSVGDLNTPTPTNAISNTPHQTGKYIPSVTTTSPYTPRRYKQRETVRRVHNTPGIDRRVTHIPQPPSDKATPLIRASHRLRQNRPMSAPSSKKG